MIRSFDAGRHGPLFGVAALAAGLLLASAAAAAPYNPDRLPDGQIAQVDQACHGVIGLETGETPYAACVASLSDSVRDADASRTLVAARRDCRGQGFGRDTPGLADCTLRGADGAQAGGVIPAVAAPLAKTSYFYASREETFQRERAACAALGFDPTSAGFGRCSASLRSALLGADNPF